MHFISSKVLNIPLVSVLNTRGTVRERGRGKKWAKTSCRHPFTKQTIRLRDKAILGIFVNNDLPLGSVCKLDAATSYCCCCCVTAGSRLALGWRQRKYLICVAFQAEAPSSPELTFGFPYFITFFVAAYYHRYCKSVIFLFVFWYFGAALDNNEPS